MKVLHIIPSVGPLRGGPSFVMRSMAQGLASLGLEIHVATTNDNAAELLPLPVPAHFSELGVHWHYFPRQHRALTTSLPLTAWVSGNLKQFDLAHIHAVFSWPSTSSAWIARHQRVPYLIRPLGILNRWGMTQRRPWLKQLVFHSLEKGLIEAASAIHYTADQERLEAEQLGFRAPAAILPNPVEHRPATIPRQDLFPGCEHRFLILFLSRISEKKGLDLLIPAFALARRQNPAISLVIAGEGEPGLIRKLRDLAASHGVDDGISWPGFVEGPTKWSMLAAVNLFVLPSYSENFGVAAAEAMACGVPVLLTDQVGLSSQVRDAGAGLVTPCDVDSLGAAMLRLSLDSALGADLAARASTLHDTCYSTTAVCRRIAALYDEILRNHRDQHHS